MALFKERLLAVVQEEDLEPYLSLVEELAEESGRDIAEIAAAAARLARGDRPLAVPAEPEPEQGPPSETGMVRLFIDAGRRAGVRPGDIVGAITNEAGVPGRAIGAIDIYDDFTFVEVPARYSGQVLAGMRDATVRNRGANIRVATAQDVAPPGPRGAAGGRPGPRAKGYVRKAGKPGPHRGRRW
jgi:ATP-dependent RNA helicase DeaD